MSDYGIIIGILAEQPVDILREPLLIWLYKYFSIHALKHINPSKWHQFAIFLH